MHRPLWGWIAALVFSVGCALQADDAPPKRAALLVGVNKYLKPGFRDLDFAEADVQAVAEALRELGFEVEVLLGSGEGPAQATRTNIEAAALRMVDDLGKRDIALVMLSGHGQQLRVERDGMMVDESYYCPVDARVNDSVTQFSLSHLLDDILRPNVGRKLLLVDACRDVPIDPSKGARSSKGIDGRVITLPEESAVFFSCRAGQQSFERHELGHGLFTHCVLEALRTPGEISWSGLVAHVDRRMSQEDLRRFMPRSLPQVPIAAGAMPYTVLGRRPVAATPAITPPAADPPSNTTAMTTRPQPPPATPSPQPAAVAVPATTPSVPAARGKPGLVLKDGRLESRNREGYLEWTCGGGDKQIVDFSSLPGGGRIVVVDAASTIQLLDSRTGRANWSQAFTKDRLYSVTFDGPTRVVAVGRSDSRHIFDAATGRLQQTLPAATRQKPASLPEAPRTAESPFDSFDSLDTLESSRLEMPSDGDAAFQQYLVPNGIGSDLSGDFLLDGVGNPLDPAPRREVVVTSRTADVSVRDKLVTRATKGEVFPIVKEQGDWYWIAVRVQGVPKNGWIHRRDVTVRDVK